MSLYELLWPSTYFYSNWKTMDSKILAVSYEHNSINLCIIKYFLAITNKDIPKNKIYWISGKLALFTCDPAILPLPADNRLVQCNGCLNVITMLTNKQPDLGQLCNISIKDGFSIPVSITKDLPISILPFKDTWPLTWKRHDKRDIPPHFELSRHKIDPIKYTTVGQHNYFTTSVTVFF